MRAQAEFDARELKLRGDLQRRELTKCSRCGRGLLHHGVPLCYRVTIERLGFDAGAVQRRHGLELMTGSPAIAEVFSTGEPLARRLWAAGGLVCEPCAMEETCIAQLEEVLGREPANADDERREDARSPEGGTG